MQLSVENGPLAGTTIPLERDRQIVIGSAPDSDLHLEEPGIAEHHAVVKALKSVGFGIKAVASGLRINGREVAAAPLQDGDEIQVGSVRIRYRTAGSAGDTPIPGFRILGILGKGGMGVVYRAEQVSLHREVALKVLSKQLTRDPAFIGRFVAEARAAARLSHPNVVQVFDVDSSEDTYFYSMEVMHEGSLEAWLRKNGRMPVERALQVIADAASGLSYAESLGMVHRDIKPDNLMLDQHGTVKIADLGLAHTEEDPEEKLAGTPHFMAPEQVLRKGVDHRTDLYALGCTFYRLITGRTPFRGATVKEILRAHLKDDPEPPHRIEAEVPPEVSAIIQTLMAKEPELRYQSADELLADLHGLMAPAVRRGLWIGLTAAAILLAGVALIWALTRPDPGTTVEVRYRDNPEAQRLALENERLLAEAKEARAEIALLQVQVQGLQGADLVNALERVTAGHPDTRSASTARDLAGRLRTTLSQQEAAGAARQAAVDRFLTQARQAFNTAVAQHRYGEAAVALAAAPPAEIAGEAALGEGLAALEGELRTAVQNRLALLRAAVSRAMDAADADALAAALPPLSAALDDQGGLPPRYLADLDAERRVAAAARSRLAELQQQHTAEQWTSYQGAIRDPNGLLAHLGRLDFGAGSEVARRLQEGLGDDPAGARAAHLAAVLQRAAVFAGQLEAASRQGQLQLRMADGLPQNVVRWQRDGDSPAFVVLDQSRRPTRESTVAQSSITCDQWSALASQVTEQESGGAACFVAVIALATHARRARSYLQQLDGARDDSGTGETGYPLGADLFETLMRQLPPEGQTDWSAWLRGEVQAGRLLAAGLRALSERRNLAAATHLDRLLQEHPYSIVVAALP